MQDLSKEQQSELLKKAWSKKYSFLLIKAYEGTPDRYYVGFDKVVFDDDKKENINEEILETESN